MAAHKPEQQQTRHEKGYHRQRGHRILDAKVTRDNGGCISIVGRCINVSIWLPEASLNEFRKLSNARSATAISGAAEPVGIANSVGLWWASKLDVTSSEGKGTSTIPSNS